MPSGWDIYYVVFLSALLALAIPAALWMGSAFFRHRTGVFIPKDDAESHRSADSFLDKKVNARFFLAANAALALIALVLALIPCAGTIGDTNREGFAGGLVSIVVISGLTALGLLYAARKGDLSWLRTYQQDSSADILDHETDVTSTEESK